MDNEKMVYELLKRENGVFTWDYRSDARYIFCDGSQQL